ncbi:MAG: ATP-binding cassette domain-containing protein, partial [Candidatus Heimdallarchaeota archaeon]|nr:ATP-binding cassette domain-containing protein [Candidatus Heimdallarchaeota archaeon]
LGGMTFPSTGSVTVDNMLLNDLDDHGLDTYRRNVVGFLWQLPERNLLPNLTALENITFSMEVSGYPRQERITRAKELLKSVGLGNRMNHKLGQLSGGEAQRASLSVALANKPKVLLADEPTGELDSETTMEIIDYLKQLNADLGLTIVVVTHDNRFERLTHQSYNILDGSIAGLRRSRSKLDSTDWRTAEREEVAVVDQFGKVRIPSHLRQKYHFGRYIRFIEDTESGRVYIEGVEHEL